MATHPTESPRHPAAVAVARLHTEIDELLGLSVWSMDQAETATTLASVTRLVAKAQALELKLAAHAVTVKVEEPSAQKDTATWWANHTMSTKPAAHRKVRLAAAMTDTLAGALGAGEVLLEQAEVIVRALEQIPAEHAQHLPKAEELMVSEAAHLDARGLKAYGRAILHHLDPEAADAHEAALLDHEEAAARAAARHTMTRDGHGKTYGRYTLPDAQAAILEKMLLAFANPARHHDTDGYTKLASPHRMGLAFMELIERYPSEQLPDSGGLNASAMVILDHDTLLGGLTAAHLDTGHPVSASQARRWLCEAGIIPAVLGGDSEVLDLGRTRRFHSKAQRIAKKATHLTCQRDGCDMPTGLCHMHHPAWWARDHGTTGKDGVLLCARDHHLAHDPHYEMRINPNGTVTFHRRQ